MGMRKEGMSWISKGVLVGLAAAGCATHKAPVSAPPPERENPAAAASEPDADRAFESVGEVPAGNLRLAWSADTQSWNRIVAISPSGDVVSVGSGRLQVHARDTGQVLESTEVCYVKSRRGLAFVSRKRALLACTEGVAEVSFPGLSTRMVTQFESLPSASVASPHGVAFAMRGGAVQVLDADGFGVRDRFTAGSEVEEIAFSPDGRLLAVGLRDGRVLLRDLEKKEVRELVRGKRRATGLAFSRDGSLLFVNNERFGARVLQTSDGASVREHLAGPWISAASGLGRGWFAAAGSEGLVVYRDDAHEPSKVEGGEQGPTSSCEGLAVSGDGSFVCAGDRQGRVVCYTTRDVAPTTYEASASAGQEAGEPAAPAAATKPSSVEGTIELRSGDTVTVQVERGPRPEPGAEGNLFRRFDHKVASMNVSGWLLIARIRVVKHEQDRLVVGIVQEQSSIRVDGKAVDHFGAGTRVKVEWEAAR